ncbi:hypothetical protein FACS189451_06730 [Bacteroidia bacterium]|nr:hypothetical protein FACS189451_06730 [Bacteroidia bacterium]
MKEDTTQNETPNQRWYKKILPWFGIFVPIISVIVAALVKEMKMENNWTWLIITIAVLVVFVALTLLLQFLMRTEGEDIMRHITKTNGALNDFFNEQKKLIEEHLNEQDKIINNYLKERLEEFANSGTCLSDVQKDLSGVHGDLSGVQRNCQKRIQQNFLKQEYEKIGFFNFHEILDFEKSVKDGEIWIVTDDISTDVDDIGVYDTVGTNIKEGIIYNYFHNSHKKDEDSKASIMEALVNKFAINDIDKKLIFTPISKDYNALLTIAKDIIILHPNNREERRAFLWIYADANFRENKIAFYRELLSDEIKTLWSMIKPLLPKDTKYNKLPEKSNQFIIFKTEDDKISVDVRFESETVWLTQEHLVELFQSSKANISEHIKHIFEEREVNESSVVRKFRTTASDGKTYDIAHYNLDMIISLGYRINSKIATKFRQWATLRLKEYNAL